MQLENNKRIAVIGIVIEEPEMTYQSVNNILSNNSKIIVGRMGIPYKERDVSIISLIVDGTSDEIGSMTGKLGNIKGVKVKVAFTY